jgi:hypothetical protein
MQNFETILNDLDAHFSFRERPFPVPASMRVAWRVNVILLGMHMSAHSNSASLQKIHALVWACLDSQFRKNVESVAHNGKPESFTIIRYDPAVDQALDLCIGEDLVRANKNDKYSLKEKGDAAAYGVLNEDVFKEPKDFFRQIGKKLSERKVEMIARGML